MNAVTVILNAHRFSEFMWYTSFINDQKYIQNLGLILLYNCFTDNGQKRYRNLYMENN